MGRAARAFAGCFGGGPDAALAFVGLPDDSQSSFLRGCRAAPRRIRRAYDGDSFNSSTELEVDLRGAVHDRGDVAPQGSWARTARRFRAVAEHLFGAGKIAFFAGGDHSVTIPVVEALAVVGAGVHVIQVDAHPDLYPSFGGKRSSHACVAARLMEMDHVASLTQIGLRTQNHEQRLVAERHPGRLRQLFARDLTAEPPALEHLAPGAPVYLTIDMDGLDPSFAPGVSHPVPGGLSPRFVFHLIQHAHWRLLGMDVVEVNPARDVNDLTSILAGRLLHEGMGFAASARPIR